MRQTVLLSLSFLVSCTLFASDYEYKFRLTLTDKGNSGFSIENPESFLSEKSIERRTKQNIKINETDLPISADYLTQIESTGAIIVAKSKWLKTVAVHCKDSAIVEQLDKLPFVSNTKLVWRGSAKTEEFDIDTFERYPIVDEDVSDNYYGKAYDNIKSLNGDKLHNAGFKGENMNIAVIDAGFNNYPKIDFLDNINLKGYKNFVYDNHNLFKQKNQHGTNVISCIATNKPNIYVGTAPNANFWMLGSEDSASEFPIEEDYWATAIEYADSIGIDVVNTSLGYTKFDAPATGFDRSVIDGKTALISRAAATAVKKGIFLVISAGNSGNTEWGKVSPPADAPDVLSVGAIQRDSVIARFSSRGLTADLRIKPDVVALGSGSVVIDDLGKISHKSGTSFSSPIMCGIVACLWQAYPSLTNIELLNVIRESSDRYDDPDTSYGFGIPDMVKAMNLAQKEVERKEKLTHKQ